MKKKIMLASVAVATMIGTAILFCSDIHPHLAVSLAIILGYVFGYVACMFNHGRRK